MVVLPRCSRIFLVLSAMYNPFALVGYFGRTNRFFVRFEHYVNAFIVGI